MSENYWKAQAGRWKRAFWSLYNDGIDSEKRAKINKRNAELRRKRVKKQSTTKRKIKKNHKNAVETQISFF